jgi:hypothetical protein
MHDHIRRQQLEAHIAYYDRALRSVMELIEGTLSLMKGDGLTEVVVRLRKASLEIEDAWAELVREHASSLVAGHEHGEPHGAEGDVE